MLHGKLVALRALEKEDAEHIKEWLSDSDLIHAMGGRPIPIAAVDPDKLAEMFRLREGRVLAIVGKDRSLIGVLGVGNVHEFNRSASIIILIAERGEWNRGYGTDALRAAARFAFEELNLNSVEALIPTFNERALHVFQKAGFQVEGTLRERFFARGKYWDLVSLSAVRRTWTGQDVGAHASVGESIPTAAPAEELAPVGSTA